MKSEQDEAYNPDQEDEYQFYKPVFVPEPAVVAKLPTANGGRIPQKNAKSFGHGKAHF